ncbi:MAG: serine/threonine protein kinase [Myxococcaceae bacterium]|nr:serine/threonine protein kinase [Myxococcaceae bacterium]
MRDHALPCYHFGTFILDLEQFELRHDGQRVPVQPKVLKLLIYLVANRTVALSAAELIEEIWPHETVTDASLRRAIRGVRRALGDGGDAQAYVRTVRGRGYQFVVPVEEHAANPPARRAGLPGGQLSEQDVADLTALVLTVRPQLRPHRAPSDELVRYAPRKTEVMLFVRGCLAQIQDALERGRLAEVDRAIQALDGLAQEQAEPVLRWYVALFRTMRATVDGRFAQAELLARSALRIGACAAEAGRQAYAIQMLWIYVQQGRFAEAEQLVRDVCTRHPSLSAWHTALTYVESCLGRTRDLRADLRRAFTARSGQPDVDLFPVSDFAPAAELCLLAQDEDSSKVLYHVLLPFGREHAVVSVGLATHGPLARQLGMLAGCLGHYDDARAYFERAIEETTNMPAPALLAFACFEYARMLQNQALREGDGDTERSSRLLAQASDLARALDMRHLSACCTALARTRRARSYPRVAG